MRRLAVAARRRSVNTRRATAIIMRQRGQTCRDYRRGWADLVLRTVVRLGSQYLRFDEQRQAIDHRGDAYRLARQGEGSIVFGARAYGPADGHGRSVR